MSVLFLFRSERGILYSITLWVSRDVEGRAWSSGPHGCEPTEPVGENSNHKECVATEKIPIEIGKKLARLQQKHEKSDYDDFFIASQAEVSSQIEAAKDIINAVTEYLK